MSRPRPSPPRPDILRRPSGPFGWLEARLLQDGWLARLGPDATAVLVLLALAADGHGASFYGRDRMAALIGIDRRAVDAALDRLLRLGLVAHRPWREGHPDGVWQILPLAPAPGRPVSAPVSIQDVLSRLGLPRR